MSSKIHITVLALLSLTAAAQESTYFGDAPRNSVTQLANPREMQTKITFMNTKDGVFIEPDVSGELPFYRHTNGDRILDVSARGLFTPRFDLSALTFDMWNIDYMGGISTSYRWGLNGLDLFIFHESSHLGAAISKTRTEFSNGFERIRLIYSRALSSDLDLYSGMAVVIRSDQPSRRGDLEIYAGANYAWRNLDPRLFVAVNIESEQVHDWFLNTDLEVGYLLGKLDPTRRQEYIFINLYSGFSPMGQYYLEKELSVGTGIGIRY